MKLLIDDVFAGIGSAEYETLYFDETFNEAVGQALQLGRRLLRFERTDERIVRHVEFEPVRDPSSPGGKALGNARASVIEELDYDRRTRQGAWRVTPNMHSERVRNVGTIEIADAGGGARRIIRGEVKVSAFGFGRIIERMVIAEIVKSYANTTRFTNEWIARRAP